MRFPAAFPRNTGPQPRKPQRLRLITLVAATYFMVSGGPYGIEDILGGAGYRGALLLLILLPFIWTLPTTLMIGELASALPEEGGFYVWVRRAMGPFWGFMEAWLSLAASVFDMAIYPTLFTAYLSRLSPALTAGWHALAWELALIAVCCAWNLRGAPSVGRGSMGLFAILLAPFAILCGYAVMHGLHHPAPAGLWTERPTGNVPFGIAVIVAMWNYMGWDNASTVAQEVENPPVTYPRAMLYSGALVAITYILPLAAVAFAGIPLHRFSTGAWADAGRELAGPWLAVAIVAGGTLSSLGMFNALTLSYTRLPMVMAEDGLLPRILTYKNSRGVPVVAIMACGLGWALALGFNYERLISIDLILYGSSLVLEFVALLVLRVREPRLYRPFRMGSLPMAAALSAMPISLVVYALWATRSERLLGMPAVAFGGLVTLAGAMAYGLTRLRAD
jgi:amino acid transporter